eukprot:11796857-Ditylum_brightwellii.AAC.1
MSSNLHWTELLDIQDKICHCGVNCTGSRSMLQGRLGTNLATQPACHGEDITVMSGVGHTLVSEIDFY